MKRSRILFIGPFPPPRHGLATANEAMHEAALDSGMDARKYDTAPPSLNRSLGVRMRRLRRIVGAFGALRAFRDENLKGTAYFSVSGGFGSLYEMGLVLAARVGCLRIVLHHHSFRYLDAPFWPISLLMQAAGRGALHVVQSPTMGKKLKQSYSHVTRIAVMNNATLVGQPVPAQMTDSYNRSFVVGYMANLSRAKGLDDMLALAEIAQRANSTMRFKIAGPFENPADEGRYRIRISGLTNVECVGPVYGAAYREFWRDLDAFAFPTRYRNEAEPLVVHEALRHGKPVVALGRGCIADQVGDAGCVLSPEGSFAPEAWRCLAEWEQDSSKLSHAQERARRRYETLHRESLIALGNLLQQVQVHDVDLSISTHSP